MLAPSIDQLKVLQCYAGNLYGGIERQLVMFAQMRRPDNPLGRSFALCFDGRLQEELAKTQATVYPVGKVRLSRPWTVLAARRRLKEVLHSNQYDLVICHAMWPLLVFGPAIQQVGLPLCVWAHDCADRVHWIDRLALRARPDMVISNSDFTRAHWARFHPDIPCRTQYYPLPKPPHDDPATVRARKRAELQTPSDAVVLLIAARFEVWKGHAFLIEALGRLASNPRWRLWIAGGSQRGVDEARIQEIKRAAKELGIDDRVQWLGSRSDVFDVMLAADIYCQPNLAGEPFGVVFVEAMHAGLPVITANIGGPTEFIDVSNGRLVAPNDVPALVAALSELIDQPDVRRRLGEAGQRQAEARFGLEPNLQSLNATLSDVVTAHHERRR